MKLFAVLTLALLVGCAQGQFSVKHKDTVVDVSTLRATDITIRDECTQAGAPAAVEVKPRSVLDISQASEAITQVAALLCGL